VIAEATLDAVLHPRREVWIAWSATKAILGQRLIPGVLDRYLARHAWDSQHTRDLPRGHPLKHEGDNVDTPLPGDPGAHGPFDRRTRRFSTRLWAREHRGWLAGAAALVLAGVVKTMRGG
jgi:hypothetical protein